MVTTLERSIETLQLGTVAAINYLRTVLISTMSFDVMNNVQLLMIFKEFMAKTTAFLVIKKSIWKYKSDYCK